MQGADHKKNKLACPECGSTEIARSRRRGLVEHYFLRVLHIHPYRCMSCNHRFVLKGTSFKGSLKQAA
jgi:predicted RNA-binding Zn-ribbon protein involved in translation (DUF1610 family)